MKIDLYREAELYKTIEVSDSPHVVYYIRHDKKFSLSGFLPESPYDPTGADLSCIEAFQLSIRGVYQSVNFKNLPSWVIQQELEEKMEKHRQEEFDRITRMMMNPKEIGDNKI